MSTHVSSAVPLLTPEQAAEYLNTSADTLAVWRSTGRVNIPFVRIGRAIRYRLSDLEAYVTSKTVGAVSVTE
jgi:excisionase family DNA binding protein